MDTTIIAAIITAIGTIAAAVIGIISILKYKHKATKENKENKNSFEKSKAFYLGFSVGRLEYFDNEERFIESYQHGMKEIWEEIVDQESQRCKTVAQLIGINSSNNNIHTAKFISIQMDGKTSSIKAAFKIGNIIGHNYFFGIKQYTINKKWPNNEYPQHLLHCLEEAENLIGQAELPHNFLLPVKKFWNHIINEAKEKRTDASATKKMEQIIDQLTDSIEKIK